MLGRKKWVKMKTTMAGPEGVVSAGESVLVTPDHAAELIAHHSAVEATAADIQAAKDRIAATAKRAAEAEEARVVVEVPKQIQPA